MDVKRGRLALAMAALLTLHAAPALAASASEIDRKTTAALQKLYAATPEAKTLAQKAKGILVFPSIVKGGFMIGGQVGDGALRVNGKTVSYYRSVAGSFGLQAGVHQYAVVGGSPSSSCSSARAFSNSRLIVRVDRPRSSATSAMDRPAKPIISISSYKPVSMARSRISA